MRGQPGGFYGIAWVWGRAWGLAGMLQMRVQEAGDVMGGINRARHNGSPVLWLDEKVARVGHRAQSLASGVGYVGLAMSWTL